MAGTIEKTLLLSAILLALGLIFAPISAHAAECLAYFDQAGKVAGTDLKAAADQLDQAGNCCAADLDPASAQKLAGDIKLVVNAAILSAAKGNHHEEAGKIMASALGCAGQPGLVAVDPTLYSTVLADSSNFVELARDESDQSNLNNQVQFARLPGSLPSNNQQPTVSIEQK